MRYRAADKDRSRKQRGKGGFFQFESLAIETHLPSPTRNVVPLSKSIAHAGADTVTHGAGRALRGRLPRVRQRDGRGGSLCRAALPLRLLHVPGSRAEGVPPARLVRVGLVG